MRQNFNYHTHTYRCGHAANCPDEQYVKEAIKAGFKVLGFSDHAPYYDMSKKEHRMDYCELEGYINSINSLKEKYKDKIEIKLGLEMEYLDCYKDYIDELRKKVDFMILGQHYFSKFAYHVYTHNHNSKELLLEYGRLVETGIRNHDFLYVAHPDYFCGGITEFDETCQYITRQICQAAQDTKTPLEVNIKFNNRHIKDYNDGKHYEYPFRAFWEIASQYDIKCVYGFDAHNPEILSDEKMYEIADSIISGLDLHFIEELEISK